jgi:hypothetical protein
MEWFKTKATVTTNLPARKPGNIKSYVQNHQLYFPCSLKKTLSLWLFTVANWNIIILFRTASGKPMVFRKKSMATASRKLVRK